MQIKRQQLSIILIVSSIILLLIFQWLWLQNEYKGAQYRLHGETSRVFINSVREIRDSLFQDLIKGEWEAENRDSVDLHMFNPIVSDSIHSSFQTKRRVLSSIFNRTKEFIDDSTLNVLIRPSKGRDKFLNDEGRPGSITGLIALVDKSFKNPFDSDQLYTNDYDLSPLIESYYQRAIRDRNLPERYELLSVNKEEEFQRGFRTRSYTDRFSNKRYAIFYLDYRTFLFKQILPQIAFSIVLLVCISLAFFFIYQSLQKQRRLTQIKNDFISNVTHELKTPITTVGVAIEAMSSFNVLQNPERTQEYLDISKHELNRLSILVDRVLKMALFEQSEPELKMENLDIKQLAEGIISSMRLQFEKHQAEINFHCKGDHFFLKADRIHLTSVIYNLIDNALKYSISQPHIQVSIEQKDKTVHLKVQDEGMGISKEYLDKIFDKFFRVPTGDQHNIKGHGLGLSYVASVIEKHKGRIHVSSEVGKGTLFHIILPSDGKPMLHI